MSAYEQKNEKAFPTLDEEDLEQIARVATCETFQPGETILHFGQRDIDLIVVDSGGIDILNPIDDNQLIVTHGPGQFVGDIDLLTRRPIIINAIATGKAGDPPTRVMRVPGAQLRKVLNTVPRLGEKLIVAIQVRRELLMAGFNMGIRVIGPAGCGATNRVREFLYKNFVPFVWKDIDCPDGEAALAQYGHKGMPLVDCGNDQVLHGPTLQELAKVAGIWHGCDVKEVDLAIVGGGPAGIAAAVYAASEGLNTVVLDQLGPGGQAGGSSRIENFIGFPAGLSGTDLATRGVLQMLKFGAQMVAPVKVDSLDLATDEHSPHLLHLDCGNTIRAHTILATTGVTWRRLPAKNAEKFERAGVYYACTTVEAGLHQGCDLAVIGGGNSAGQAVMFLAGRDRTRKVHLLVRRPLGSNMSEYLVARIRNASNVVVHENSETTEVVGKNKIEAIIIARKLNAHATTVGTNLAGATAADSTVAGKTTASTSTVGTTPSSTTTTGTTITGTTTARERNDVDGSKGETFSLPVSAVFVFIGAEPRSDWLPPQVLRDKAGYIISGTDVMNTGAWPLKDRDPCPLETTVPRILVGGDLRSGSTKRVGFAVGDGSLAVTCAHKLRSLYA